MRSRVQVDTIAMQCSSFKSLSYGTAVCSNSSLALQVRHSPLASASRQNRANAAAVVSIPVEELTDAQRQEVADNIGYRSIGKPVPKDISLSTIVKSMPSEVWHTFDSQIGRVMPAVSCQGKCNAVVSQS